MPIGPNFRGSEDSMMQYTYLPRLASGASATDRPCTIFSDARRAGSGFAVPLSRTAAFGALAAPFDRAAALGIVFAAIFFAPARTAAESFDPLRTLADVALGMFAAPAAFFSRGGRLVQHFPDFFHEVFRQAGFGHERVAARPLRALGDAGERVAGQRDDRNRRGPIVGLQAPRRLPAVHDRQRQVHEDYVRRLLGRFGQRLHAVL